jgi:toxin ParE1/3/4
LLEIWQYLAARDSRAADRTYERLEQRIKILEAFPEAGPARPEIAPDARVLIEAPYLIFYWLIEQDVQIVRVLHGARRITGAMFRSGE